MGKFTSSSFVVGRTLYAALVDFGIQATMVLRLEVKAQGGGQSAPHTHLIYWWSLEIVSSHVFCFNICAVFQNSRVYL